LKWAAQRNLIGPHAKATPHGQVCKTLEEATELLDAINRNDLHDIRDAIGDVYVTLVIQAEMHGLTMSECIDAAWDEIKDRKGSMQGGVFVKEPMLFDRGNV
jgi:NTP pyrophosphatase (non-canonical NTP hydrolase)